MTDALGGRVDLGMTSQHPRDLNLPISTSQAFIQSATSGVARASLNFSGTLSDGAMVV